MTTISQNDANTQRGRVLEHLRHTVGSCCRTTRQIREATGVERVQARLAELRRSGWDIRGSADGLGRGADGTQQYYLAGPDPLPAKIKVLGITVTQDYDDGVDVRIHQHLGDGMTQSYSRGSIEELRTSIENIVQGWVEDHEHHLRPPTGWGDSEIDVDALFDSMADTDTEYDTSTYIDATSASVDNTASYAAEDLEDVLAYLEG